MNKHKNPADGLRNTIAEIHRLYNIPALNAMCVKALEEYREAERTCARAVIKELEEISTEKLENIGIALNDYISKLKEEPNEEDIHTV